MKIKCVICGVRIRESMGFLLARDIISVQKRVLCQRCSHIIDPYNQFLELTGEGCVALSINKNKQNY